MAIDIPRIEVPGGSFVPASYGLFSAAAPQPYPTEQGEPNRGTGVQFRPAPCGPASLTRDGCVQGVLEDVDAKVIDAVGGWIGTVPFTAYAGWECAPAGTPIAEARQYADQALLNGEQWAAERHLANLFGDSAAEVIAGGVVTVPQSSVVTGGSGIVSKLAELENAMGNCVTGEGIIHVQRRVVPYLSSRGLVRVDGDKMRTYNGNVVVVGSGYTGAGPAGQAASATSSWMYGTGPVGIWRSEVFGTRDAPAREVTNIAVNLLAIVAERTYNVAVQCCLLAAQATLAEGDG